MSDPNQNEPGRFGEDGAAVIQVTPGQIVGAALFLMVAAAIIFFAGMFARGLTMSTADKGPTSDGQESDRLDEVAGIPAPPPEAPNEERRPRTRAEKVESEESPREPEPAPAPEPEPEPEPDPEVVEHTSEVVEPEPESAEPTEPEPAIESKPPITEPDPDPPTPEDEAPAAEPQPAPLPEIPPSTTGPYTVQVMSIGIAKRTQAEQFQRDAHENKNVQMELVESTDGKLIRAYVGSYADRADAESARDELAQAGFDGCFIKKREE